MKQIICPDCGQGFAPADYTERKIEGHPALKNIGLSCPHCDWFGHLFVEDMRLRRRRATVATRRKAYDRKPSPGKWSQIEKAQADLARVFDEVQAHWRPVLGLVSIGAAGEVTDQ